MAKRNRGETVTHVLGECDSRSVTGHQYLAVGLCCLLVALVVSLLFLSCSLNDRQDLWPRGLKFAVGPGIVCAFVVGAVSNSYISTSVAFVTGTVMTYCCGGLALTYLIRLGISCVKLR
jgi:hypothetical protein